MDQDIKTAPNYSLYNIAGIPYLLPYGQGIADHKRGIRLNETGVFLWNTLQKTTSRKDLLKRTAAYYEAAPEELPIIEQDITEFLNELTALGILQNPPCHCAAIPESDTNFNYGTSPKSSTDSMHLKIGPILLHLIGPTAAFSPEFQPFAISQTQNTAAQADLTIELKTAGCSMPTQGIPIIRHPELCVFETDSHYRLLFPQAPQLTGAWLAKDGSYACIYHTPLYAEPLITDLFHAIRFLFLYTAQRHGCFALHSASILYREKAWLFSGPSGMGKSTHTDLWNKIYGSQILNGDLNLLSFDGNMPVVYGIPWCGTSGISDTATHRLGGIILLDRAEYDGCQELPSDKKILLTSQRLIAPAWTASMLKCNLDFISDLTPHIAVCMLHCTKKPSAAAASRHWIDDTYRN